MTRATTAGRPPRRSGPPPHPLVVEEQRQQRHGADAPHGGQGGAQEHVLVLGVPELVGDHDPRLCRGEVLQQVVVDHDAGRVPPSPLT